MRRMITISLILLIGLSFAWTNDAAPELLKGRYEFAACDVDYAKEWLDMREGCAEQEDVPVFDSSEYVEELEEDLDELEEAADEGDQLDFGLNMVELAADSLEMIGAVIKDALTGKNMAFFSCVRDGEEPLIEDHEDCRADALASMEEPVRDYLQNELDYAEEQIEDMEYLGADTGGMEDVVDEGYGLMDDVGPAFDSGDPKEVQKLHARHTRLVMLFRMEKMLSTIDYARPIIEDGNNGNKEEILEEGDELEADIEEYLVKCAYDDDADDLADYRADNLDCWGDAVVLFNDFNSIRLLILDGA